MSKHLQRQRAAAAIVTVNNSYELKVESFSCDFDAHHETSESKKITL